MSDDYRVGAIRAADVGHVQRAAEIQAAQAQALADHARGRMLEAGETLAEQRDRARSIAVRLEEDTAVLAWLHAEAVWRGEVNMTVLARDWRRKCQSAEAERDNLAAGMLGDSYERAELLVERDRGHDLNVKLLARMDRLAAQVANVRALADRWDADRIRAASVVAIRTALDGAP